VRRVQRACGDMSDEEFSRLVLDIARMKLRFEEIDARALNGGETKTGPGR